LNYDKHTLIRSRYDDGGYSGGSTDRPDLQRLLDDNGLLDAAGVLSDRPVTSALDAPPSSSHLEMALLWFEHFGFCLSFG
jgi:hypothetical protein